MYISIICILKFIVILQSLYCRSATIIKCAVDAFHAALNSVQVLPADKNDTVPDTQYVVEGSKGKISTFARIKLLRFFLLLFLENNNVIRILFKKCTFICSI